MYKNVSIKLQICDLKKLGEKKGLELKYILKDEAMCVYDLTGLKGKTIIFASSVFKTIKG